MRKQAMEIVRINSKKEGAKRFVRTAYTVLIAVAVLVCILSSPSIRAEEPLAREIGCFPDNRKADPLGTRGRNLDGAVFKDPAMTVKKCLRLCSDQGFKYAGLQNGSWCFCGNNYGRYKAGAASCTTKCTGDQNQFCGGEWANSVWELLEPHTATPSAVPSSPAPYLSPQDRTAPSAAQTTQRFNKPMIGGIRLDSRPAAGSGFDVPAVAHSFCQRMGFSKMLDYRVADARQTIAIQDSTLFTNKKGTNTTYRFIVCGP